jgi:hypothetical protein
MSHLIGQKAIADEVNRLFDELAKNDTEMVWHILRISRASC